ncbi:FAD-binding domain-containing protein [Aquabacterium sp. A08]|uniref:FAD-binding domain-containing protein n=1 Tax=Aquabacterium sp. A08 TaxID=2718532 RepID=UPI0014208BA7|nr:FAD-binding domain-containing protein [Aquabacterium sp. A08]NIC40419.1 deoxyribodipyrimidine photolyase [Aquabacterium sp. A08]
MSYRVVWFKRDLRVHDHAPLADAARQGSVLCLYVVEPSLWAQPDAATQHYRFIAESLADLDRELRARGSRLHLAVGEVVEVLDRLHHRAPFAALHAHEETGNGHTHARDRAVARWCRERGVAWREWPQFGVVRGLRDRRLWQPRWEALMAQPQLAAPERLVPVDTGGEPAQPLTAGFPHTGECLPSQIPGGPSSLHPHPWSATALPSAPALGLPPWEPPQRQRGGRARGLAVLDDFLSDRSARYRGGISSPLSAPDACSRLSAHLAYGSLGLREVVQATRNTRRALPPEAARQKHGLQAFHSRLYWHCHFIQKLESEPELEWRNLHRGYDGLREADWNPAHFDALTQGRTGWPMVDACVAMLRATGWLNFRMRAMLVSVAAYPLWLHWREVGHWLAREFLDYEPGIHWPQVQMQSGTTGINATRVYNPVKQALDHDPHGHFVRRWLPALRRVPDSWLFEPWRMPPDLQARCGVRVGDDIPAPPVDLATALRQAKDRLHALRRQPAVKAAQAAVVDKHGSRRGMPGGGRNARGEERPAPKARRGPTSAPSGTTAGQLSLDF